MQLIGQYDSPFVRRVGIAMRIYGIEFTHLPHSVFRDAELIAPHNPLRRVPTLILDDGRAIMESFVCLEYLDERVAADQGPVGDRLLLPRSGPQRLEGLRLCALATGIAEKAVSLAYEREVRESVSPRWSQRCTLQIRDTLAVLESELIQRRSPYFCGDQLSHADIAVTCAWTFLSSAHPNFLAAEEFRQLGAHAATCEARAEFAAVFQPFDIPKG